MFLYLVLFSFVALAFLIKTPGFKGWVGETLVHITSKLLLNKNEYHVFWNVTLPTEDGTTQIDHIIVSKYGIFVVETKNMKGWIYGSEKQPRWTQKFPRASFQFQNPLRQNYKHLKTLEKLLSVDVNVLHSVIVFVGSCKIKSPMPANVTRGVGFVGYIKSNKAVVLSDEQVLDINSQIKAGRLTPNLKTHRAHVEHVLTIHPTSQVALDIESDLDDFRRGKHRYRNTRKNSKMPLLMKASIILGALVVGFVLISAVANVSSGFVKNMGDSQLKKMEDIRQDNIRKVREAESQQKQRQEQDKSRPQSQPSQLQWRQKRPTQEQLQQQMWEQNPQRHQALHQEQDNRRQQQAQQQAPQFDPSKRQQQIQALLKRNR